MKSANLIKIAFLFILFSTSSTLFANNINGTKKNTDTKYIQKLITKLADRIYCTGETTGISIKQFYKQEQQTAKAISEYYSKNPKSEAFTYNSNGITPLMIAARYGYPDILEEDKTWSC